MHLKFIVQIVMCLWFSRTEEMGGYIKQTAGYILYIINTS